jgi:hypothetical protein
MIDLAKLNTASELAFDLELLSPKDDEPTGLFIQLIGMQSAPVRAAVRDNTNDILKRNFEAQRKATVKAPTADEADRRGAKILAAATVGWYSKEPSVKPGEPDKIEQGLPFGETRLAFSTAEAEKLYANPGFDWLRAQVDRAVGEVANFLPG